jgi:hypothetical protein
MTGYFNTELTPEEEMQFRMWVKAQSVLRGRDFLRDVGDYDLRGFWKENVLGKGAALPSFVVGDSGIEMTDGGHLPDTFKKPSHPTFSIESQYSSPAAYAGGQWGEDEAGAYFAPGRANLEARTPEEMRRYFSAAEPGTSLRRGGVQGAYGYQTRAPYQSEDDFFAGRREVTGMAAEDGKIVMNPYSGLSVDQANAVSQNEAIRLWMRENGYAPSSALTQEQLDAFSGTEYAGNNQALAQSILARIVSGDPSAGKVTDAQNAEAAMIRKKLESRR